MLALGDTVALFLKERRVTQSPTPRA